MNDIYNMSPGYVPPAPKPKRPILPLVLGGILVVVLLAAALLVIDPFQWNVVGSIKVLLGVGGDPVPESIPTKAEMYMGFDLLNATPDKLNRIIKPFTDLNLTGTGDANSAIKDLDTQMKESLGVTVTDDVIPWIGKSAGVGIMDLKMNASGSSPSSGNLVVSIQSRDNAKADAFLQKLKSGIEKNASSKMTDNQYKGIHIYSIKTGTSGGFSDGIAFGRAGDVVLLSLAESGVMDAVDAQKGDSLSKDKAFQDLVKNLPNNRFMTLYFPAQKLKDLLLSTLGSESAGMSAEQLKTIVSEQYDKFDGLAASMTIVDAGLQVDALAAYKLDKMSALDKATIAQGKTPLKSVEMLPADTLVYIGANTLKETWTSLRDQLINTYGLTKAEYDQSMTQLEQQIQVNPEKDLFPYMGGDLVIAVVPSTKGILPLQAKVNLGAAFIIGTTDPAKMMATVDKLSGVVGEQILGTPLAVKDVNGLKYYNVKDPSSGTEFVSFGVGKQFFVLGTSGDLLEGMFAGKSGLSGSSRYATAVKALPGGSVPFVYLDVEGLLGKVRTSMTGSTLQSFDESMKALQPVPFVVAGNSYLSGTLVKSTIVVFITPAK